MFEAFKVGVSISLINHVSHGLSLMSRDFMRTEADAAKLESRIKSIQALALKGALAMGAGAAGLMLLKGPYEEAKKLAQAEANFGTLNLTAMENAQAFGKAASMSHKILGTTITDNVKLIHDLHTAFGDLHHALDTADMFAKMSFVAKIANGGKNVDGLTNAAAKALEHRGGKVLNDPARFEAEGDMMTKVMLATKMRVSPLDYLTASGTGKMAYQLFDPEFLYGNFAGMMAINGGARTGTAAMTAFSSLVGGHMDSKGKGFLADIGLYQEGFSKHRLKLMNQAMTGMSPEERRAAIASMGGQAVIAGGLSDTNAELYAHRPDVFLAKVMVPAIKKRFGMDLSDEQIGLILARHFNRNTGDFLATQVTMAQKLGKDTNIINKSMGFREGYAHFLKSPEGAEAAAAAAWTNFLTMFGTVYLPTITNGMLKLAGILDSLGQAVERHPTITKIIAYGVGIVSTILLLGGAFAIDAARHRPDPWRLRLRPLRGARAASRSAASRRWPCTSWWAARAWSTPWAARMPRSSGRACSGRERAGAGHEPGRHAHHRREPAPAVERLRLHGGGAVLPGRLRALLPGALPHQLHGGAGQLPPDHRHPARASTTSSRRTRTANAGGRIGDGPLSSSWHLNTAIVRSPASPRRPRARSTASCSRWPR
jgi:hypothetical protein